MLRKVGPLTVLVPGVVGSAAQPARSWCVPSAANPGNGTPNPQPPPNGGSNSGGGCGEGGFLIFLPPCRPNPLQPGQLLCTPYIAPCPP
jgi:hypothetical protein